MALDELLAALERLGDGDWPILEVRSAAEAGGSGHPEVGAAPPGATRAGRLRPVGPGGGFEKPRTSWL